MTTWNPKKDPQATRERSKYEHPVPSRELILSFVSKHKSAYSRRQLATHFGLQTEFEQEAFRRRLRAMVRDGQLIKNRSGKYAFIKTAELIHGHVIGHKEGIGFVRPADGTKDIFLSKREMRKVFDGDLIAVRIVGIDKRNRREGIVTEIIERKHRQIVGKFFIESGIGFVEPDNQRISQDIIIPPANQLDAKENQLVIAEIISPPTKRAYAVGKIIEVLGDYMAPGMETEVAIRSFDLPHKWSPEIQNAVKQLPTEVATKDLTGRMDLRNLPLVTIDGEDAKDFDDAVYCEKKPKGGWRLLVAIADVEHYVKPNSLLDKEAKDRGTSVYFTGRVLPMLPHALSNGLCSLKPNVDRLCVACDMVISADGKITRYRFCKAVMHSHARLTYNKVAKILAGDKTLIKQYANVLPHLQTAHELYKLLLKVRHARGALDFEMPEIKVEFGAQRKIKRLYPVVRNDAHRIIEEFMLCANTSAAKFLLKNKCDALFRVHDGPDAAKFAGLKEFLRDFGLSLGGGDLPTPIDYAKLIDKIQHRPDAHLIQTVLLRSLTQAFYSPTNDGHFGLAYDEYTHFTSPIRRYPDLIVHRAICAALDKHQQKKTLPDYEKLQTLGEHCSMTERRADDATYEALDWLKCEYMLDKIGETFDGIITGVTNFGIFVELKNIFIEGLIHITALEDDYYYFDAARHKLIGERSGKTYQLGNTVKIKVARVSLEDKQIDFTLALGK